MTNNSSTHSSFKMYANCMHTVHTFPVCFSIATPSHREPHSDKGTFLLG